MKKLDKIEFIKRIENIFGKDKFDYSLLEYKDAHSNVKLICNNCKNIEYKPPSVLYRGFGCLKCQDRRSNPKQITKDQFINRANLIHNYKYDYNKSLFTTIYNDIEIICPNHGSFFQKPTVHMYAKSNCPECNIYKGEEKIGIWLNLNKINYIYQHKVRINDSYHYYDFFIPKLNTIIEYNGMQHYKPIKFFGGQKSFEYLLKRDKIKEKYCLDNNIELLIISYKDDIDVKLKLLNV